MDYKDARWSRWDQLSAVPSRLRNEEQDRSVMFHRAATHPAGAPARVTAWIKSCDEVLDFVQRSGDRPREHSIDSSERRCALWLRRQRANPELCEYQRERLSELNVPVALLTRGDRAEGRLFDVADFRDLCGRLPSTRSSDSFERSIAYWWRRNKNTAA